MHSATGDDGAKGAPGYGITQLKTMSYRGLKRMIMKSHTKSSYSSPAIILLANRPRFMREMMRRALRKHPRTHYVFAFEDGEDLAILLDAINAQWLVISLEENGMLAGAAQAALRSHPDLNVMGVSRDGDFLEIYRAANRHSPEHIDVDDLSLNELVELFGTP